MSRSLQVVPLQPDHLGDAAALFVGSYRRLRDDVPQLSGEWADPTAVMARLADMVGFAAIDGGRLVGYLTSWYPIESFRDTARVGAYVPGWGHGVASTHRQEASRALYRAASSTWAAAGCDVHALTVLASDSRLIETWFWSGFGMGTVDAVRPMVPLDIASPVDYAVRRAGTWDAAALSAMQAEQYRHHTEPPAFMALRTADDPEAWSSCVEAPIGSAWVAEDSGGLFAFLRFDGEFDGADVATCDSGVFISGAYVRASHRRRGVAAAILDAAIRDYAGRGLTSFAVDFEAFNPEAAGFWMRHFTPVCHSLMRVPETGARSERVADVAGVPRAASQLRD